ncbi:MAG: uncharacterized protein QOI82_1281 [Actinomycetota bacterium]|jgi:uncharacterized membrane protein YfcA|nr:uncharacterized protein [Actinomycetota bacterium]
MSAADITLLCLAAFAAGGLDAIVGGGGLLQLPALLLVLPGTPVVSLLGTNKLAAIAGTGSAAATYSRRVDMHAPTAIRMAFAAFLGSGLGAFIATVAGSAVLRPAVLVALVVVWGYTWRRPGLGEEEALRLTPHRQAGVAIIGGAAIGLYDGFVGPGTGSFLVFLLVGAVGMSFLHASATAKAVNTMTNLAALLLFGLTGHVLWKLGLAMAVCNVAGAQLGAHLAIRRGSAWVRRVFLVVVAALIVRLAVDVL